MSRVETFVCPGVFISRSSLGPYLSLKTLIHLLKTHCHSQRNLRPFYDSVSSDEGLEGEERSDDDARCFVWDVTVSFFFFFLFSFF